MWINVPSRVISSMSLPMSFMSCSLGTRPLFSSIRIIERNRIFVSGKKGGADNGAVAQTSFPLSSRTGGRRIDMSDKIQFRARSMA